jgi:signal transduction histidine kinase
LRIAHDVHDIASHSLSALVIRTEVAQLQVDSIDDRLASELRSIGDDGRRAMEQLRAVLTVIDQQPLSVAADHENLPLLIHDEIESSRNRTSVRFISQEQLPLVTTDAANAFRRFVREALVNADRYAPSSRVEVTAHVSEASIIVSVTNDPPVPVGSLGCSTPTPATGTGLGLSLTRRRLERCGATFSAHPTPDGGFTAIATLRVQPDMLSHSLEPMHSIPPFPLREIRI